MKALSLRVPQGMYDARLVVLAPTLVLAVLFVAEGQPDLPSPAIVVLDFDGEEIEYVAGAPSDPDAGVTPYNGCAGTWPPYGDEARASELLAAVADLFADVDVLVTDQAPCEGPYVRVVIGPFDGCGAGIGHSDGECDRTLGHGIAFAKLSSADDWTASKQAVTVAHEVGHTFGLAHVDNSGDIMHATLGTGEKVFLDECSPMYDGLFGGNACRLSGACEDAPNGGQNSHAGLEAVLGPRSGNDMPECSAGCACGPSSDRRSMGLFAVLAFATARRLARRGPSMRR